MTLLSSFTFMGEGAPHYTPPTETISTPTPEAYDGKATWRGALEEVERQVHEMMYVGGTVTPEQAHERRINVLRTVLSEYGKVKEGTNIPVDNGNRFKAEVAARKLAIAEAEQTLEETVTRVAA
jgi:hypothetical protein